MTTAVTKIRKIIAEQNSEFLERAEAIEAIWLCLLSGQHGYLQGPSGTAKSALLNSTQRHIAGARYWHIQLDRMLDKSDSFGQYDIARFETEKVWERDYTDTFGDCHIALLDEIDKAGPASLVPYLEMLQDRRFKPGKQWVQAPLISAFGASNTSLASHDGTLAAIADRFLVRVPVGYVRAEGNFLSLLQSAVVPRTPARPTTITLATLEQIRLKQVPAVVLPLHVATLIHQLRADLAGKGIICSDRRWKAAVWVLQATAWLDGRCEIAEDDLRSLRFVLWSDEDDRAVVEQATRSLISPFTRTVLTLAEQVDDIIAEIAVRRTGTAVQRKTFSRTVTVKIDDIDGQLSTLMGQAQAGGRDTTPVQKVQDSVGQARLMIYRDLLGSVVREGAA
jgi:MoxR-like ATPase